MQKSIAMNAAPIQKESLVTLLTNFCSSSAPSLFEDFRSPDEPSVTSEDGILLGALEGSVDGAASGAREGFLEGIVDG